MRGCGETTRRLRRLVGVAVAGTVVAAGTAYGAADTIIATDNSFNLVNYSADEGSLVPFQNSGSNQHNVTATATGPDGKALFRSSTITSGRTTVRGTEYLTAGSYPFICTVHPDTMKGNLNVSTTGAPKPRPALQLRLLSRKLVKVVKKRTLVVQVTPNDAVADAAIEARLGKTSLGKLSGLSLPAGAQNVKLKLSKQAKAKLARKNKAKIGLNGSVPFGAPSTAKGKLR